MSQTDNLNSASYLTNEQSSLLSCYKLQEREALLPVVHSSKTVVPEVDGGATKKFELDTAKEVDSTAIYKRNLEESKKDDFNEEYKEVVTMLLYLLF